MAQQIFRAICHGALDKIEKLKLCKALPVPTGHCQGMGKGKLRFLAQLLCYASTE